MGVKYKVAVVFAGNKQLFLGEHVFKDSSDPWTDMDKVVAAKNFDKEVITTAGYREDQPHYFDITDAESFFNIVQRED